ncbi:uncharacterized protein LOC130676496 [Microplitis mediator]|uniref:uncharacterized protein LOC130676496 n=1 Tax=Microplitis mediator TaxID=375433 RepID=UPI0025542B80|nr:uncharacterized protein LOC130676496 [Microplitis mediator]
MDDIQDKKFGATDSRFVPRIPSPRPPLPRMMTSKPIKLRTVSTGQEPDNSSSFEDDSESDTLDVDETDNVQAGSLPGNLRNSPENKRHILADSHNEKRKTPIKPKAEARTPRSPTLHKKKNNLGIKNYFICGMIVTATLAVAYAVVSNKSYTETQTRENTVSEDVIIRNLEDNIDSISYKFKQQYNDIWDDIIAGIAGVVRHPDKPAIIFLFSNLDSPMTCLAKMIGNASKAALGSSDELWLSPSQMGNDPGFVIDKFQDQIEKQKIVIVENLLDIDPEAMMAFHHLCDRETPLVKEAVFILTMVAKGYDQAKDKAINFVENQLELKLKGQINPDKVEPLITRMTDGVIIPVQPEPDIKSCPLRY